MGTARGILKVVKDKNVICITIIYLPIGIE